MWARSVPIPHRSCHLRSEDLLADTARVISVHILCSPMPFDTAWVSQLTEITQFISSQDLKPGSKCEHCSTYPNPPIMRTLEGGAIVCPRCGRRSPLNAIR